MGSNSDAAYEDYAREERERQKLRQSNCNHEYIYVYFQSKQRSIKECRLCGKRIDR